MIAFIRAVTSPRYQLFRMNYFSSCDQIPNKKQLKGNEFILAHGLRRNHGRESLVARAQDSWSHCV